MAATVRGRRLGSLERQCPVGLERSLDLRCAETPRRCGRRNAELRIAVHDALQEQTGARRGQEPPQLGPLAVRRAFSEPGPVLGDGPAGRVHGRPAPHIRKRGDVAALRERERDRVRDRALDRTELGALERHSRQYEQVVGPQRSVGPGGVRGHRCSQCGRIPGIAREQHERLVGHLGTRDRAPVGER